MVSYAIQVVIALGAWFILMLVSTNLIGIFARGLFENTEIEDITAQSEYVAKEYKKSRSAATVIGFALITLFFGALNYFWNIGLVIASVMLMAARALDLKWEVTHGRKLQMREMDKPKFHLLSTLLSWASLPVVWYALYRI